MEEVDEHSFKVEGCFLDTLHEIKLTMLVSYPELEVTSAYATMLRTPYPDCPAVQDAASKLSGIKIGPGSRKAIQQAVGHNQGCTHLTDLALDMAKVIIQAKFQLQLREMTTEEWIDDNTSLFARSCHHWTGTNLNEKELV